MSCGCVRYKIKYITNKHGGIHIMSVSVNGGEKREKCRAKRVEWLVPDVDQDLKTKSLSYP